MCFSWTFSRLPSIHDFWIFCAEINWSFSLILHHLFKYLSFVNPSLNTTLGYVAFSTASRDPRPPCPAWRLQATLLYLFTGVTCSCPRAVFAECCFRITCVKSSGKGIPIAHSWRMILALLTWGFWESVLFSPLFLCHTTFENCGLKSISVKIKIQLNFFFFYFVHFPPASLSFPPPSTLVNAFFWWLTFFIVEERLLCISPISQFHLFHCGAYKRSHWGRDFF